MKTLWEIASLACLLIGLCPAGTYRQCSSPQYAEIGQQGTVECVFPANFSAIVWYDSEDNRGSQVARIERQADKSLRISENSAEGGTYRIALNGSLIIPLVSTHHDRNFTVFIVDENSAVSTFVIKLITVVYPNADAPMVNSCEGHSPCLVHAVNETHLSCTYKHARPAVILSWYHYKSSEGKLEPLIATQQSFREDGVTFTSVLNIYIANMTSNVLSLFTCEAVGPALKGKMETNVLVTNALSERCVSCRNEIPKRNVILDTLLEIPCIDNGIPYAYVWQLEQHKRSQTLVSSVKNKANFRDDINIAMNVSKEGALIISRVNFRVTGIYTCFSVGVGISSAHSVEVKVQAFSDGSSTSGRTVALIMAVIASILFLAVFVGLVVAIVYRKKLGKELTKPDLNQRHSQFSKQKIKTTQWLFGENPPKTVKELDEQQKAVPVVKMSRATFSQRFQRFQDEKLAL
ncbi:hypothetical protein HOLleu_04357 [Holothuria leucospilota]|uniref:Immunoglobulin domain-containing protein n=1 Tax=Holothuria leucospilota TaxID=206669 RepID=A0A9Q1CTS1_HOLLE|nr:hypothetical protein HOLleu_04357 [Holothuria leucospilota]